MSAKWIPCGQGTLLHPFSNTEITTEVVEQKNWGRIFEVYHYNDDPEATQRLIVAAPEMFDALQAIVDAYGDRDTLLMAQCKAALAKAKGEA